MKDALAVTILPQIDDLIKKHNSLLANAQRNHAFDLLLPQVSAPAQAALYYLKRFLALVV